MTTSFFVRLRVIGGALVVAIALTCAAFHVTPLGRDITSFLPHGRTQAARFMLQELRAGSSSGIMVIGLENAPPPELARIATAMSNRLKTDPLFRLVAGAGSPIGDADIDFLFKHRYLLAPLPENAFAVATLHDDFARLLDQLQGVGYTLAARFGMSDPTGAFYTIGKDWLGEGGPRIVENVWFAQDRDRALLVVRLRSRGLDTKAQEQALAAVQAAFVAAHPGQAILLPSGPAVFANHAERQIKADVERLSLFSTLLVAALLVWRFRSIFVIGVISIPILLSLAAGAIAVRLIFGELQGAAFGFGMTMLGVTVDYPVLMIGHRKRGEPPAGTVERIGGTLLLTVVSASLGLLGMLGSGFPGLIQIGVFSIVGVLAAGLASRYLLPPLIAKADLAPVEAGDPAFLLRWETLRHAGWFALLPAALAGCFLLVHPPHWGDGLAQMNPVPLADQKLDAAMRTELGAGDTGWLAVVHGPDAETVLRQEEAADLSALGDCAARYLPSRALQQSRQRALPDQAPIAAAVGAAQRDLPFQPSAFDGFEADIAHSKTLAPLVLADLPAIMRNRLEPLLFARDGEWFGITRLRASPSPDLTKSGILLLNLHEQSEVMLRDATSRSMRYLALGTLASIGLLGIGLRDATRLGRVCLCVAASTIVTLAVLDAIGTGFSLLHIVALQFVAGVGLDYALFFSRQNLDAEERARTFRTLITCNAMSILTFGLLATCQTNLLRQIGLTITIGAISAMAHAFLLGRQAEALQ